MRILIIVLLLLNKILITFGQCPNASFKILNDTVCIGAELNILNTSSNAIKYEWDLCTGDLKDTPFVFFNKKYNSELNSPYGIATVKQGDKWFSFITNQNDGSITRILHGKKLDDSIQSVINLGNFGGILNQGRGIKILNEDSLWFGFVLDGSTYKLFLLSFGTSLLNYPFVSEISEFTGYSIFPLSIDYTYQNDSLIILVGGCDSKTVSIVNFGSSILNKPVIKNLFVDSITGLSGCISAVTVLKTCNGYFIFINENSGLGNIIRLEMGNSLLNEVKKFSIFSGKSQYVRTLKIVQEMDEWNIFYIMEANKGLRKLSFDNDIAGNLLDSIYFGNYTNLLTDVREIELAKDSSNWYILATQYSDKNLIILKFPDSCKVHTPISNKNDTTKNEIIASGKSYIELRAINDDGFMDIFIDTIVLIGPTNEFSMSTSICLNDTITFIDKSYDSTGNIMSRSWSFGDLITDTAKNPNHKYNSTGNFNVSLTVESDNGCINKTEKDIIIIDKPSILFNVQSVCVKDSLLFKDITKYDSLINLWSWQFGDSITSTLQSPSHLYTDTGKFEVTFETGVEGCTDTIIDTISFYPKPVANFNTTDICIGDSTIFNDSSFVYLSSLTPVNKWNWNLGDSNTDTNQFPMHVYSDSGKYQVSLIVTTTKNCYDTVTKFIDIQKPIAKFLIKEKICDNFPIPFIDTSTVNADSLISWKWGFVNGDSSILQYPTYSFPDSGTFNIYLKVTSSQNCTHDTVIPIYVNLGPTVAFLFDTTCASSPTSFTDKSSIVLSDTIITWAWDFGDSSASDNSQNTQHTYSDGAQYSVTLNVATQKGCKGIKVNNVIVKPLPVVNFGYSNVCVNNNVNFYDFSSVNNVINDSIVSWKWFFDDGNTSTSQNPVNLYSSSTTKNVLLIAYTNNNCFDSLIKPVIINPLPIIDYTYTDVCEPETTSFSSSSSLYNLFWVFGEPTSGSKNKSTAINPTHIYKNAGNYLVNLIAVSTDNCTTKVNKTVSVSYIPTANFITDSICQIYPANFFDSSIAPQSAITEWKWDFDDGTSLDTIQNPFHSFSDTGKYTVNLFVFSEKGCSSEVSKNVQVNQLPDAKFDFTPQFGIPPLNVSFKNKTNDVKSYKWYFGDGDTSLDASPSHTYTDTGEYIIKFYVINEYGCIDTLRDLIRVKAPVLDLIVNELLLKLSSNYYESTVNFTNIGNRDIENINFELVFVNGSTILEEWTGNLLPSENNAYTFSSKTKKESISQSDVVCVNASLINNEQDDNPEDNKQCVTLNKEIDIVSPIYDYENKTVTLQIISNKEQNISINFYDQLGKVLHRGSVSCNEGYNAVEINVVHQQAGLYIYTIANDNELIAGKVTILN